VKPSKEEGWKINNPHHYTHLQTIPKYNITRIIKYRFIWGIINKQSVPSMGVGKFREENIKVFVENWLLKMIEEKMIIFLAQLLSKIS
jgi:hypothetical protein